jgi:hypothetical protein
MTNLVEIFDPPMCCPGGMCGPAIDPALLDLNEALIRLKNEQGLTVSRYLLMQNGQKFMQNREISTLLKAQGTEVLPITTVNGKIVKQGAYPTYDELMSYATQPEPAGEQ